MSRPILYIRADANTQIGSGHLVRSLALGQAWQSLGGRAVLITSCGADTVPISVRFSNLEVVFLPVAHPDPGDLGRVLDILSDCQSAWVSCDGYHFDVSYTRALCEAGKRVLVVDDIAHAALYHADVILNQNIFSERLSYVCELHTRKLLGPRYALLRREFAQWVGWRRPIAERARHVLVTMGGGDPFNQTLKVIQALKQVNDSQVEVKVIVGSHNEYWPLLQAGAKSSETTRFELFQNPSDIPALLAWADVAVSAGGSTCWELCFMGVPSLLITFIDNQAGITGGLAEAQAAVHLGWFTEVSESDIAAALRSVLADASWREALSRRAQALVDGHGALRVARLLRGEPEDDVWAN